jgi:hypothetical protein
MEEAILRGNQIAADKFRQGKLKKQPKEILKSSGYVQSDYKPR